MTTPDTPDYQLLTDERLAELEAIGTAAYERDDQDTGDAVRDLLAEVRELRMFASGVYDGLRAFAQTVDLLVLVATEADDSKLQRLLDKVLQQTGLLDEGTSMFDEEVEASE